MNSSSRGPVQTVPPNQKNNKDILTKSRGTPTDWSKRSGSNCIAQYSPKRTRKRFWISRSQLVRTTQYSSVLQLQTSQQ